MNVYYTSTSRYWSIVSDTNVSVSNLPPYLYDILS